MLTALVIHGHFYQPPRENPWTDVIDDQPTAAPFPNWNERVYSECYRPNAFARIVDPDGRIVKIVNNYELISFNFGSSLLSWMERHHPFTYRKVLEADRLSALRHRGHGNAMAQAYNHAILPLCNERDARTQIRWGLEDFKRRFQREPESLWLSETAVNDNVMGYLIDEGLKFLILSPHQALRVRPAAGGDWKDVSDGSAETGVAYRYLHRDGSGRSLAVFFYDTHLAKSVAFEGALRTSEHFMGLLEGARGRNPLLVHTATDGESYGHHFKFGDRGLAYALTVLAGRNGFTPSNYGEFLELHPPEREVEIKPGPEGEGTAWSCSHGVGRWIRDCGCHTGGLPGWNQAWRAPLRAAFDFLRDRAAEYFEAERGKLFIDPWAARDDYIQLVLDRGLSAGEFLEKHAGRNLSDEERVRALTHLEVQRNALLMYTSCAWFFNDLSGIETIQVLQYTGRILYLLEELGVPSPKDPFLELLEEPRSNLPASGTGADLYRRFVETAHVPPNQVAAHLAMAYLADTTFASNGAAGGLAYRFEGLRRESHGRLTFATSQVILTDLNTQRQHALAFAALHLGGIDFSIKIVKNVGAADFETASKRLWENFYLLPLARFMDLMAEVFGKDQYGMEHLLPEGRRRVFSTVFGHLVDRFASQYATLYEENRRNLEMLQNAGFAMPRELTAAAEFTLGRRFNEIIREQQGSPSTEHYAGALDVAREAARRGLHLDLTEANSRFTEILHRTVLQAVNDPTPGNIQSSLGMLELTHRLGLTPDLNRPQELVYEAVEKPGAFNNLLPLAERLGLYVPPPSGKTDQQPNGERNQA